MGYSISVNHIHGCRHDSFVRYVRNFQTRRDSLSCITGLDNQSIARTRSLTSISWWIVLFRLIASSLTRCAEICQAGRQENAKEPKIPSLRHSPHSGIGLKRSPKPKSDVESTGTKIRIDAIAPISRRMQ